MSVGLLLLFMLAMLVVAPVVSCFIRQSRLTLWTLFLIAAYVILPYVPQEPEPAGSGMAGAYFVFWLWSLGMPINAVTCVIRWLRELFGGDGYR